MHAIGAVFMGCREEANPGETIESRILLIRGRKVLLSMHLAELYQVEPKVLIQAVKRNLKRFPIDFMFQITWEEVGILKSTVLPEPESSVRSQIVTLQKSRHIKHLPYVFTEQGVAMLSSVLRSDRAIQVNIEIMRTFVRIRQILASHTDLAEKLAALENRYDTQFKVVFDALRELMAPPVSAKSRRIGFIPESAK
jgi:hypothetical protein